MNEIDCEVVPVCQSEVPLPSLEEGVDPDLLDKIAEEAESYASAQATEAAERAVAAASRYTRAIVWYQVFPQVHRGAYYDKFYRLLRDLHRSRPPP